MSSFRRPRRGSGPTRAVSPSAASPWAASARTISLCRAAAASARSAGTRPRSGPPPRRRLRALSTTVPTSHATTSLERPARIRAGSRASRCGSTRVRAIRSTPAIGPSSTTYAPVTSRSTFTAGPAATAARTGARTGVRTSSSTPRRLPIAGRLAAVDLAQIKQRHAWIWGQGDYSLLSELLRPAARALCDACAVSAGQEVLDVAAGDGNFALVCAAQGAKVVASDLSPGMIERGRARSEAEGFEVQWVEADAEDLPFEDDRFDCVGSVFGAVIAPRPEVVARELVRV